MGALCYKPDAFKAHIDAITGNDFDELQRKALDVLSEKSDADASFLYFKNKIPKLFLMSKIEYNLPKA